MISYFNVSLKKNTKRQTKKHPVTFVEKLTNFRQFFQTDNLCILNFTLSDLILDLIAFM